MLYRVLRGFFKFVFYLVFGVRVKGRENMPAQGAFILAANHLSYLDPILLGIIAPRRIYFLAKEELFRNRIFGRIMRMLGALPVKRGKHDISAMKQALKTLRSGRPLVIFPQGERGSLNAVKPGVGFLFRKAKVPLVLAKIKGTDLILPPRRKWIKLGKIEVILEKIIEWDGSLSHEEFASHVLDRLKAM